MSYFAPFIDASGLHIPDFDDIESYLVAQFQTIFGPNVYLGNDSADFQLISIFSRVTSDTMQAAQVSYNNRGPATAIGAGLDVVVGNNGLERKPASNSTCVLTVVGVGGTIISGGIARDVNGILWSLPSAVTIPIGGSVLVTALCKTPGPIGAPIGTITNIASPTYGWNSVNNAVAAVVGTGVETDSQLRARQAFSAAIPSQTRFEGTIAEVAAVLGVTRRNGVENPNGSADIYGNPAHSISIVAEGGLDADVAAAIYLNKSLGCYTNGTTTVNVVDPNSLVSTPIRFFRPTYVQPSVVVEVHLLPGGSSQTLIDIAAAIVSYLNSLQIGELIVYTAVVASAMAVNPSLNAPIFSIRSLTIGSLASGILGTAAINAAGTGYTAGDVVYVNQANSSEQAMFKVTSTAGGGAISALQKLQTGSGYTTASGVALGGGTGTGATVNITTTIALDVYDIGVRFNEVSQGIGGDITVLQV